MTDRSPHYFSPGAYRSELTSIIGEILRLHRGGELNKSTYEAILRRFPKDGTGFFSKSDLIRGFRLLNPVNKWSTDDREFPDIIRMKPIRTLSGVAPVTVLTRPFPCPGRCIFCPSDVRMPKSYLSDEPGAQRAAQHQFDPYLQTVSRLLSYRNTGHQVDKVELIILGGTWSSYPESYQIWFIKRCFDAMNEFEIGDEADLLGDGFDPRLDFREVTDRIDGSSIEHSYNEIIADFLERQGGLQSEDEIAMWSELADVQLANETAHARCVGLVVETRPDNVTDEESLRMRRLGATKIQIGFQSLSDEVLRLNNRGHDVATTRRAVKTLRRAGFKIHAHWMPNLYGSTPAADIVDFGRMFADPDFRPDELKIYPCSLIESAELMAYHRDGRWHPYTHDELVDVLTSCLLRTPEYCRITRVIRDIPGTDIVEGNRTTNFREVAEKEIDRRGAEIRDIRSREIRAATPAAEDLRIEEFRYAASSGSEIFLQYLTEDDRLAAFLRLSLPVAPSPLEEIATSAMIREVHVYGRLAGIGERREGRAQHLGLGRSLIERAVDLAGTAGYSDLAVISSVGTREYYRGLGFTDGPLYQHLEIGATTGTSDSTTPN